MDIASLRSDKNLWLALFLALLGCSCAHLDTHTPQDYIGPKVVEPDTLPAEPSRSANLQQPDTGPLRITTEQATLLALENNRSLVVERLNPQITQTFVPEALSIFDPVLTGQLGYEWNGLTQEPLDADRSGPVATAGVQEFLPTGTSLGVTGSTSVLTINGLPAGANDFGSTIAFNATQSLLRGFGTAVNLASVNQARIDVEISQYELRGFVQTLIAQVEETYWDYALAERQIEILQPVPGAGAEATGGDAGTHQGGRSGADRAVGGRSGSGAAPRGPDQRPQHPGEDQAGPAASGQPARRQTFGTGRSCWPASRPVPPSRSTTSSRTWLWRCKCGPI